MKHLCSTMTLALVLSLSPAWADEVSLIAPGGIRCAVDKLVPQFEAKTGHKVKPTIGAGGATHQQVVNGEPFDVPIVQPPYKDVIDSGHVIAGSETPLATVPLAVVVKKGAPKPDISTPEAFKRALLGAKAISYPDGRGGRGGAAGVSFDGTQRQMGIYDQIQPKVKRVQGVSLMQLVTRGDIDFAVTYTSEVTDPEVEIVGVLPSQVSTPTALVGFVSAHAKSPAAAKALLDYLASSDAAAVYKACGMKPGR